MRDHKYRGELIGVILEELGKLHPRKFEMKSVVSGEDCPHCHEEESFYRLPEFKYGRCTECQYEVGFDYYSTVMDNRLTEYNDVVQRIKEALGIKDIG